MYKFINILSGFLLIVVLCISISIFAKMVWQDILYFWRAFTAMQQAKRWENIKYIAQASADGHEKANR